MTPEQIVTVRSAAMQLYPSLKKRMEGKKETDGFEPLVKDFELIFSMGVQAGLGSEAKAWAEVNRLEDLIVDMLRYAPDSDVAKARLVARETFDDPTEYAKAVSIASGSTA